MVFRLHIDVHTICIVHEAVKGNAPSSPCVHVVQDHYSGMTYDTESTFTSVHIR